MKTTNFTFKIFIVCIKMIVFYMASK